MLLLTLTWLPTARDVRSNKTIAEAGLKSCRLDQVNHGFTEIPLGKKNHKNDYFSFQLFFQRLVMRLNRKQIRLLRRSLAN